MRPGQKKTIAQHDQTASTNIKYIKLHMTTRRARNPIDFFELGPIAEIKYMGILSISKDIIIVKNSLDDTTIIPPTSDRISKKQYSLKKFLNCSDFEFEIKRRLKSVPETRSTLIVFVKALFSKVSFKK